MWFFAGYVPQFTNIGAHGHLHAESRGRTRRPSTSSSEDHNITYNVSSQVTPTLPHQVLGQQPADAGRRRRCPTVEPDFIDGVRVADSAFRTSTANPANFPGVLYNNNFTDSYRSINDWVVSPKLYVNVTAGFLRYGTRGRDADRVQHQHPAHVLARRTPAPAASGLDSCPFPDIPANLQQPNGYADGIANSRTVKDDYYAAGHQHGRDLLRQLQGAAHVEGWLPVRAARQRRAVRDSRHRTSP